MASWLQQWFHLIEIPDTYLDYFLSGPTRHWGIHVDRFGEFADVVLKRSSLQVETPGGSYHKNDLIYWGQNLHRGLVQFFLQIGCRDGIDKHVAVVEPCIRGRNDTLTVSRQCIIVNVVAIGGVLPYIRDSDIIKELCRRVF